MPHIYLCLIDVSLLTFIATGLYLDQRDNRKKLEILLNHTETQRYIKLKNKKILNPNAQHTKTGIFNSSTTTSISAYHWHHTNH